jgi:hypothetical protein
LGGRLTLELVADMEPEVIIMVAGMMVVVMVMV